jgi:uroporphyrinogen decarboxylase
MVKPHLKRVVDRGKHEGCITAYHCCGAMREIIPDLIEIGIDIINPIQAGCPGMEPASLKEEFGDRVALMGGVDTQYLIPQGSPDDIRRETEKLIEVMTADGGGYILAASHTIPPEAPDENIFALYEAAGLTLEEITDTTSDLRRDNLQTEEST